MDAIWLSYLVHLILTISPRLPLGTVSTPQPDLKCTVFRKQTDRRL